MSVAAPLAGSTRYRPSLPSAPSPPTRNVLPSWPHSARRTCFICDGDGRLPARPSPNVRRCGSGRTVHITCRPSGENFSPPSPSPRSPCRRGTGRPSTPASRCRGPTDPSHPSSRRLSRPYSNRPSRRQPQRHAHVRRVVDLLGGAGGLALRHRDLEQRRRALPLAGNQKALAVRGPGHHPRVAWPPRFPIGAEPSTAHDDTPPSAPRPRSLVVRQPPPIWREPDAALGLACPSSAATRSSPESADHTESSARRGLPARCRTTHPAIHLPSGDQACAHRPVPAAASAHPCRRR